MTQPNPQLLVNFNARLDDKMKVSTTSTPTMTMGVGMGRGYYGYRGGMYGTWPMYQDQTTVSQYKEGTLNIDIVDRRASSWCGKPWSPTPSPRKSATRSMQTIVDDLRRRSRNIR